MDPSLGRVGIGIITRNRSGILNYSLQFFNEFGHGSSIVVVDDDTPEPECDLNKEVCEHHQVEYFKTTRLGIAKAKNLCLELLGDCDHYFLFDDDAWPVQRGWEAHYIELARNTGQEHLMHLLDLPGMPRMHSERGLSWHSQCGGVMLYLTKKAKETTGGWNPKFNIYGYEHAELSRRIYSLGLTQGPGPYISSATSKEWIYSLDFNLNNLGEHPPGITIGPREFMPSLIGECERIPEFIAENSQYL